MSTTTKLTEGLARGLETVAKGNGDVAVSRATDPKARTLHPKTLVGLEEAGLAERVTNRLGTKIKLTKDGRKEAKARGYLK